MKEFILANEPVIRLGFFFGMLLLIGAWEFIRPRRALLFSRWRRWPSNFALVFFNTAALRFIFPVVAVGVSVIAAERGWGLLNLWAVPSALAIILSVLVLDFMIYLQHVMVHAVPMFWRLHRLHHADLDYDMTTGARFHPFEILLSMCIKLAGVALLGAPAVAVVIFEVLLNATAMFNHGNIRIPPAIDGILRLVVVTPDMHRVHHSSLPHETNSNFGFNLPWWDRIFGTYRAQPEAGHEEMEIGIEEFREAKYLRFDWLLLQPFLGRAGDYTINRPGRDGT
ncbi:MAG: sterol desaturase family protein [Rhodospirillales bacterium]|nr:sterol desaturase family protein [Rhodospirillales bacterium]